MECCPVVRRWLSIGGTLGIFAIVFGVLAYQNLSQGTSAQQNKGVNADGKTWPVWGGTTARNLVNEWDKNVPTAWGVEKGDENIVDVIDLGTKAYGGPIIADGKIFIGTNNDAPRNKDIEGDKGIMMCFAQKDHKFLWQAVHDKLPAGRVSDWPQEGICSAPVVEGKRLYYVSNRAEIVCADTEGFTDGKNDGAQDEKYKSKIDADFIWRLDMIKELNVFPHNLATCSALIVGDILFVVTSNGVAADHIKIPQPDAPSFIAVDKKTGKLKWKSNIPGTKIMHGQWSNPVYAHPKGGQPQIIFPGGDGWMYGFEPDTGKLIWKFDCNPKKSVYILGGKGTRNDFVSTPVVWEDKLYIGVGQDPEHNKGVGHLWCIDITKKPANEDKDLSPVNDNFDPKAAVNKNSGLVWHYGGFVKEGEKYTRPYWFGRTLSTAAIRNGLLYIGEYDGVVHCFDAKTGKHHWEHDMRADTWCSTYWVDGKIYIGNEAGEMFIFADGKEKKLLGTVEMEIGCMIRATPVVCDGVMYVMTENPCKLYVIKKK